MANIKGPGPNVTKKWQSAQQPKPATDASAQTTAQPAAQTDAAGDAFAAQGGSATSARAAGQGEALPRSGWGDQAALRSATRKAKAQLAAVDGQVNHRGVMLDALGDDDDMLPRPIIRPMYGVAVPPDIQEQMIKGQLNDKGLKQAFTGMLADGILDDTEAKALISAVEDGGKLSKAEREGLGAILRGLPLSITAKAYELVEAHLQTQEGGLSLKDKKIRDAFKGMLADMQVDTAEAQALIGAAMDGPGLSMTEKKDLQTLLDNVKMSDLARSQLSNFVSSGTPTPVIVPMYGVAVPDVTVNIKDKGLRAAVDEALKDRFIDAADADALIKAAKDGPGLSKTERDDLKRMLREIGQFIAPAAESKLRTFLGMTEPNPPSPPIYPMYGVPVPPDVVLPDDPAVPDDPVIVPMYGVAVPPDDAGGDDGGSVAPLPPPVIAMYGVSMPSDLDS